MDGPSALRKAQDLSTRSFSSADRRRYFEHLLTLPSYKVQSVNTYYAKSIARHFSEFEDLQDQAVDAVLDLCEDEDEQTRISGIQALAEVGKVEPRWVRGNTGVLLQLLECQLRNVKQALFALLDVSPSEVFSIMAEDCKGTEAETGASRRNILEFLSTDARSKRKELLESGKYIEAENTFSSGFYNVLGTTAIAESRLVLSLLLPLSTISGRNSTRASSGKFAKTLIKCLHPKSSVGMTMPVIKLWAEFVGRTDGLDPRWMMCFLSDHGDAVVQAAIEKGDKEAKSILEYPNTSGSSRLRRYFDRDIDRVEPDLEARKLLPAFAQTMLNTVFRYSTRSNIEPKDIYTLELVMYGVYSVLTLDRYMRDHISRPLSRQLMEFGQVAKKNQRSAGDDRVEEAWLNLRDMAEILGDRDERAITINPSWTMNVKTKAKGGSTSSDKSSSGRHPPGPSSVPSRSPLTPAAPVPARIESPAKNEILVSTPPPLPLTVVVPPLTPPVPVRAEEKGPAPRPAGPALAPPVPAMASVVSTTAPITVSAPTPPTTAPTGLSIRSRDPQSSTSTRSQAPLVAKSAPAPSPSLNILPRAKQVLMQETAPALPPPQGLSIRASSKPAEPPVPIPQGISIRAMSKTAETHKAQPRPAPPSLLSRMSGSATNIERTRNDQTTQTQNQARIQSPINKVETPVDENPKSNPNPAPSLLSRMTSRAGLPAAYKPDSWKAPPTVVLSIKRSGTGLDSLPKPIVDRSAPTPGGFSIKHRATPSSSITTSPDTSSEGLRIKRKAIDEAPPPDHADVEVDYTPIVRKGRGFAPGAGAGYRNEILVTPPNIVKTTANPMTLANRLGGKRGRFA